MFRSRETGRCYAISKVLSKGLLLLKSEDGMSTAMANEETFEFYFVRGEYVLSKYFDEGQKK